MKFSEAIRLGAMMKPQIFGRQSDGVGTCANGAALDACGALHGVFADIFNYFPLAANKAFTCPACGDRSDSCAKSVGGLIAHLNDDHRWTREKIADFVETMEPQTAVDAVGLSVVEPVAVHAR